MASEKLFTARNLARRASSLATPAGVTAVIDEAREGAGEDSVGDRLVELLKTMPRASIEAFQRGFDTLLETLDAHHLQDVAWIIDPACDEDGYAALRANILALPAAQREAVLAGDSTVLATIDEPLDPGVLYAAYEAYGELFDDDLYDALAEQYEPPHAIQPDGSSDDTALARHAALWNRHGTVPLRIEPFADAVSERCTCCRNRHTYLEGEVREHGEVVAAYYARFDLHAEHGVHFAISVGREETNDLRAYAVWMGRGDDEGVVTRLLDPADSAFAEDLGSYGRLVSPETLPQGDPVIAKLHRWTYEISHAERRIAAVMDRHVTLVASA